MSGKKRASFSRLFNLVLALPSAFGLISGVFSLIEHEARVTSRNLASLLILSIIMLALITSTWLCVLTMLFIYLTFYLSSMISLLIILILNVLLLTIIALMISVKKDNLFFPETRQLIKQFKFR